MAVRAPFPAGHVAGARRCRGSGGGGSGSRSFSGSRSLSCSAPRPSPGAPDTAPGQQRGETTARPRRSRGRIPPAGGSSPAGPALWGSDRHPLRRVWGVTGSSCGGGSISCPRGSGRRGLVLPGVLGGVGFILPEQGFPCRGRCGGNAPRPARPGGIPCRDGGGGMRASSCLAGGNPLHPEGGGEWEGYEGVPSCPAVLWRCQGMQKAGQPPRDISEKECSRWSAVGETPPAYGAGKTLAQGAFGRRDRGVGSHPA